MAGCSEGALVMNCELIVLMIRGTSGRCEPAFPRKDRVPSLSVTWIRGSRRDDLLFLRMMRQCISQSPHYGTPVFFDECHRPLREVGFPGSGFRASDERFV